MELVADRFMVVNGDRVVDLAGAGEVMLVTSTTGGATEQSEWARRCDWFFKLRHRAIAPLVDYGMYGEMRRFEAWQCGAAWRGSRKQEENARDRVARFLRANRLSEGSRSDVLVRSRGGCPVVVPPADAGHRRVSLPAADRIDLESCGLQLIDRDLMTAMTELFAERDAGQRVIGISAAPGAGVTTAVGDLSRAARLSGYIPLSLSLDHLGLSDLIQSRSLFLIADRVGPARACRGLLEWALRSPKAHVLLVAGADESFGAPSLRLESFTVRALMGAIVPEDLSPALRRRVVGAARRSHGLPGRFETLLWGHPSKPRSVGAADKLSRVAEGPAVYGDDGPRVGEPVALLETPSWPAPGELAALKRKLERALALMNAGRHVPGERDLRSATAGLARRHDWSDAAAGALALASWLLRRGRPRDAQEAIEELGEYGRRGGHDGSMIDAALLSGTAWTDLGRLDEAESVLSAGLVAALSSGENARAASSRLALARCLFWRGRYEDAHRTLAAVEEDQMPPALAVRAAIASSRVAIGRHDPEGGMTRAISALDTAHRANDPSLIAEAACGMAFAHLAIGDRAAVDHDVATSLAAARTARDPLRALRARLIAAENARRSGRQGEASALVARIGRLPEASLPVTVRARCALLTDLLSAESSAEAVRRHVAATGLGALALFAPHAADRGGDIHLAAREVVDILRICQSIDEDVVVLAKVCALVRAGLRAAAVAFLIADRGAVVLLAADGSSRMDPGVAARAMAAGQLIAPHICRHDVEAGAPVRCGGDTHGALVVRWTLGASPDHGRTAMLLTTATAAAGPVVAGALARRANRQPQSAGELLGASRGIEGVRRSVERAAAAPFAVLVEGESGSGKELVARALHRRSPRRDRAFCTLNCAALPDDLVEAELFGHARGAFTGAVAERPGVFEEAHTGTLFLDEVGELSLRAQAKVLRTIQDGELRRVGENVARRVDVRIISATNRDLRQEVAAGRFRHDLLYRLDVVRIAIPPLRDRRDDIALLVERFWRDAIERVGSRAVLSTATVATLARYDWPGNVRELQNVLAALAVRSPKRGVIAPAALPPVFGASEPDQTWRLEEARRTFEEHFVRAALVRTGGHRARAAEELGVTRQGLTKLLTRLGIS